MSDLSRAKQVIRTEIEGLQALEASIGSAFEEALSAVDAMRRRKAGRLIVAGIGKSGHIARKIAATLASTGTPAYFVHPGEASHGDLGMVTEHDVVLMLSNSGENQELSDLIHYTRRYNITLISMTSNADSTLAKHSDIVLLLPKAAEACPNVLAPTTSTTMMIALGKTFEPSDATDHISEAGIPEEHAVKGTVCYECHRHMDPMRLVFSKFMDIRYRGKTADGNINPSFSFHGVTENFNNTNQFASILKNHPEVGPGWVQKVCVWGNSVRCDENDPEFKRLVDVFKNNNFNMKILMRQFFSSPIFTGATETALHTSGQDVVSLSRGNHYCKAIDARLKQINAAACKSSC